MEHTEGPGHEQRDVNLRAVALAGAAVVLITALALLVVTFQFETLRGRAVRRDPAVSPLAGDRPSGPPEPRLQTTPASDLAAVSAAEEDVLRGYGWVDRRGGVVRIPIARAKELVAEGAK